MERLDRKKVIFVVFYLFLTLVGSFLLGFCVHHFVFQLSNPKNASENESIINVHHRHYYRSLYECGIIPFQALNPWTVQVFIQKGSAKSKCGGSFISSIHVMTAAHCVDFNKSLDTTYNVSFNRRFYEAVLVGFEPNYTEEDLIGYGKTDLAILKVHEKPDFVVPLCLPPKNYFVKNTSLILMSPRESKKLLSTYFQLENILVILLSGYHEKVISVIDGQTCWKKFFWNAQYWNQVAENSTWCGKDQEFKIAVAAHEEEQRNEIEDFDLKSLKFLCSAKAGQVTFKGDSGSPMVQQDYYGRWTLIAIVRGAHTYDWKEDLCDSETKKMTVDDFQPVVPNLPWIYETLTFKENSIDVS